LLFGTIYHHFTVLQTATRFTYTLLLKIALFNTVECKVVSCNFTNMEYGPLCSDSELLRLLAVVENVYIFPPSFHRESNACRRENYVYGKFIYPWAPLHIPYSLYTVLGEHTS